MGKTEQLVPRNIRWAFMGGSLPEATTAAMSDWVCQLSTVSCLLPWNIKMTTGRKMVLTGRGGQNMAISGSTSGYSDRLGTRVPYILVVILLKYKLLVRADMPCTWGKKHALNWLFGQLVPLFLDVKNDVLARITQPSNNDYDNNGSDNCDFNFGTFGDFGI